MTVLHHPDEALLLDYASGAAEEGVALLVATHLCFCAACRHNVSLSEAAGGALLADITPAPMGEGALASVLARLDAAPRPAAVAAAASPPAASKDGTPSPLRAVLGGDLSAVRWRAMGPRLAYHDLFRRGGTKVRLLKGAPGTEVGMHSHRGLEYTLVLAGGFTDASGSYGPGDLQSATPETLHNPIADPGEDCINLAVTTAPLRFRGLVQRIAAPLFGF